MGVVTAGMADAVDGGAVGDVLDVDERQSVDVTPEADRRRLTEVAQDVADDAGPGLQHPGLEPRCGEPVNDGCGGAALTTAELGVLVQVASKLDQLGLDVLG